jgi:hypothetical protein
VAIPVGDGIADGVIAVGYLVAIIFATAPQYIWMIRRVLHLKECSLRREVTKKEEDGMTLCSHISSVVAPRLSPPLPYKLFSMGSRLILFSVCPCLSHDNQEGVCTVICPRTPTLCANCAKS